MTLTLCAVDGCGRPAAPGRRGWCPSHYMRNYRTGSPTGSVPRARLDITGRRFGLLVAVEPLPLGRWRCRCDCGRHHITTTNSLRLGRVRSCGVDRAAHGPLTGDPP